MKKGANQGSPASSSHCSVKNCRGGGGERRLVRRSGPIPILKHITTSGEKYVICCLELIHDYAVRGSSLNLSKVNACLVDSNVYDMASFLIENPVAAEDDLMIGDSRRMRKVLSPLLKQFGSAKFNACVLGISEPVHSASASFQFRCLLSIEPETSVLETGDFESIDSRSYRASLPASIQGTLHCKRKNGIYHHVFSAGDDKNVYTARASKVESSSDKALECVYTFYAGRKEAIATMRVFTSITLRSSMEQIREAKFILYASRDDHHHEEINLSNSNKSKLTRKKGSLFRSGSFLKQRSISRPSIKGAIWEDKTVADLSEEDQSSVQQDEHEIAAIILRENCHGPAVAGMGGWGLKFLKPTNDLILETLEVEPSENTRNNGGCSTSMNVLIPAGIHGKPKDKSGCPSSLADRWISQGGCDCGGWDIGCPLTVLVPKQSSSDNSAPWKCKPFHLFIQEDSRQETPVLKMESIRDGSYSIHFQSTLSNLQSFAIVVAVIHSQNPQLNLHWS